MESRIQRKMRLTVSAVAGLFIFAGTSVMAAVPAEALSEVSAEEHEVYTAVVGPIWLPKEDAHELINDKTLNLQCGEKFENPVLLNLRSPMRVSNETPGEIVGFHCDHWPDLDKSAAHDFNQNCLENARIPDHISAPWKHLLAGDDIQDSGSKEWESRDTAIFVLRAGFHPQNAEAIIHVLAFSYIDNFPTQGDYFPFRAIGKQWQPKWRITYF
jgi:hypothetical protein